MTKNVEIYTLDYCPYCQKAKFFLDELKVKYKEIPCDDNEDEMRKKLTELNIKSYPINVNDKLPKPVNTHADLQLLHMGNNDIFCQDEHLCIGESEQKFNIHKINTLNISSQKYFVVGLT